MPIDSTEWFPVHGARMVWIVASRPTTGLSRLYGRTTATRQQCEAARAALRALVSDIPVFQSGRHTPRWGNPGSVADAWATRSGST
jgi:hypothetical protein